MYLKAFSIYMKHITIILLTIIFHLVMSGFTNAEELIELQTRPGVTQRFILIKPANPIASVILFRKTDIYRLFRQPSAILLQTERDALLIWSTIENLSSLGNVLVNSKIFIAASNARRYTSRSLKCRISLFRCFTITCLLTFLPSSPALHT